MFPLLEGRTQKKMHTYLTVSYHREVSLETVRRPIYSIMRQSVLILLDWLLRAFPGSAGVSEAIGRIVLVLLWRGEGVEVSLNVALGLSVEFCLEGRQLLGHAEETSDFYAENHPDYVCEGKRRSKEVKYMS